MGWRALEVQRFAILFAPQLQYSSDLALGPPGRASTSELWEVSNGGSGQRRSAKAIYLLVSAEFPTKNLQAVWLCFRMLMLQTCVQGLKLPVWDSPARISELCVARPAFAKYEQLDVSMFLFNSAGSDEGDEQVPADLLCLEDFSDSELLRGLWARYERRQIYTWLGDVLVSVNPYSDVGAFGQEMAARYSSSRPPQAPHLYAVVQQALSAPGRRQALLITGESGAGKTEEHLQTAAFVDAVSHSSRILQAMSPMIVGFVRLRHWLHGAEFNGESLDVVQNWNTSEEFLQGAEQVYRHVLSTALAPSDQDSDIGPLHRTRDWLKDQQQQRARDFSDAESFELTDVSMRFHSLTGPKSLETLQEIEHITRWQENREKLRGPLEEDLIKGSTLKLSFWAVAEARYLPASKMERRADRLLIESAFDLRTGIASEFTVSELETLTREVSERFEDLDE
ncbi:Myo1a [Symbiodinium natans]|uniref:Myo1a protein n=1 Tax=Symbiodinium natans TaxID=878477 RepID=A0A812U876_9DINO|nr:Myo1a [Symbiodinium natans]